MKASVVDIGSRLELLTDRLLVDRLEGVVFRLHEPIPQPPGRSPLPPGAYTTVIREDAVFRAYYRALDPAYTGPSNYSGHPGEITAYAESRDGREWETPEIGLFEVGGTRRNNAVLAGMPPFSHNFSPFLDSRPGIPSDERFKALAGHPGFDRARQADGLHAFVSADGRIWKKVGGRPVIPYDPTWLHAFDSQNVAFWSEAEGGYVAYFRTWLISGQSAGGATAHCESVGGEALRSISRATSPDFLHWSAPVAMDPNQPGEHLYTNQTHPYFRAPHLYVALPTRYMAGRVGAEATDAMKGSTDILFMTTRAGSTVYDRLFTEAYIRPGLDSDRWGNRANYVALNVVPTGPTEMSIYHSKSGVRYTLRTDGFSSLRAGAAPGEWVTRPLIFAGSALSLNLSASAAGAMRVEIQDETGRPVPGFELAACETLVNDGIDLRVVWRGHPPLAALAGKPVRLRFVMNECDLYAFQFR